MQGSLDRNILSVAVVGAGISGVVAARYLAEVNLSVTVFERASSVGGIWVYDDRVPPEPPYPNILPSLAELARRSPDRTVNSSNSTDESATDALQLQHAPPGPAYVSLRNNIPTCLMSFKEQDWPEGTPDYTDHATVLDYVRTFCRLHDIDRLIKFDTRVWRIVKQASGWSVDTCTLRSERDKVNYTSHNYHFDAVVICSGHHSAPKIPDIPGLAELKKIWPKRITHSKSYRRPEYIIGRNVILVGNGASAYDIAHELKDRVHRLYQVTKIDSGYIPVQFMPEIVQRVAEIASLESKSNVIGNQTSDQPESPAIRVKLVDGTVLDDIDSIVLCTGYTRSFPFLTQYHNDSMGCKGADDTVLVTDGSMMHNLHKDIFYIPEPTLSFVGVPSGTTSLALFEYQAIAIASVLSGRLELPSESDMRAEYRARLDKKGHRKFHSLQAEEVEYVQDIVKWVNSSQQKGSIDGYSAAWMALLEKRKAWLQEVFKKQSGPNALKPTGTDVPGLCSSDSGGYL